jgi:hypothetical protein
LKSIIIFVTLPVFVLLLSSVWTNNASYAQVSKQQLPLPKPAIPLTTASIPPATPIKLHAVRITTPTKGQQVPVGRDLAIAGVTTSTSAASTASHCQVSVIVNDVKPYQPATGRGPTGPADYSKWSFLLTSKYTTIKPGPANKITAKYTCAGSRTAISFYSVNVTGLSGLTSQQPTRAINSTTVGNASTTTAGNSTTINNATLSSTGNTTATTSNATAVSNATLTADPTTGSGYTGLITQGSSGSDTHHTSTHHTHHHTKAHSSSSESSSSGDSSTHHHKSKSSNSGDSSTHHHKSKSSNSGDSSTNSHFSRSYNFDHSGDLASNIIDHVQKSLSRDGIRLP